MFVAPPLPVFFFLHRLPTTLWRIVTLIGLAALIRVAPHQGTVSIFVVHLSVGPPNDRLPSLV